MNREQSEQQSKAQQPSEPPGHGDTIEDAAREATEEMEKAEAPYAGRGDGG
jgi:hypothetical protein